MKPNSVVHADSLFVEHSDVAPDQVVDGHPRLPLRPGDVVRLADGAKTV